MGTVRKRCRKPVEGKSTGRTDAEMGGNAKRLKSVPSGRFPSRPADGDGELPTCSLGRRFPAQNLQNRYCFAGFLCHL